ncbi:5-formyltetrahydrofolate cyclo-ligase [Singulisphaera acidiphila]|uniref:5-formyltetrahydrofolate cyclo-ligase n=1 Tax=Singulisphaera acidiphila (strain ATCC BAA-1392 / DSM 18658 / VKM B-2454 / MOB10) TaxID=886293 RepID=L0DQ34_SINAD|nr:5-formyltetrahydrofolate cyclo-ligase [Singulisphaera acidiphila]AGA30930.1 5,10-methenyltetrahydrofolate synthetase [Singulisphaera acidiphila DSM 18658]
MDLRAQKRQLRQAMIERILALDPADRKAQEATLAARFRDLPGFDAAGSVLLYVTAFPEEIASQPMLELALERGKRLVCPRVDRIQRRLRLYRVEDLNADFKRGMLGIPEPHDGCPEVEPDQVDWVLVPGLVFDARGFRIGRGAGHYDRLLPTLRRDVPRWALALDCQMVDALPVESHDVSLDGVVSPRTTVACARPEDRAAATPSIDINRS